MPAYRFLVGEGIDNEIRKWAAEGYAYLTLDADVKEAVIEDDEVLQALLKLTSEAGTLLSLCAALYFVVDVCARCCSCPDC